MILLAQRSLQLPQYCSTETDCSNSQVHTVDQALTFTSGKGKATIAGKDQDVKAGDLMVVPAGTQHQFVNTDTTPLVCFFLSMHLLSSTKERRTNRNTPRFSTQSIPPPNTIPNPYTRPKKRATRKKKPVKTKLQTGAGNQKQRTRRTVLSIPEGSIENKNINIYLNNITLPNPFIRHDFCQLFLARASPALKTALWALWCAVVPLCFPRCKGEATQRFGISEGRCCCV